MNVELVSKSVAEKFSIDDWVGIAEGIISAIKKCRESRNPQQIVESVQQRGGLLARISLRRELRKKMDEHVGLRKLNQIADYIIDEGSAQMSPDIEKLIADAEQY